MAETALKLDHRTLGLLGLQWTLFWGNFALYWLFPLPLWLHVSLGVVAIHLAFTIWHEAAHGTISNRRSINNEIVKMRDELDPWSMWYSGYKLKAPLTKKLIVKERDTSEGAEGGKKRSCMEAGDPNTRWDPGARVSMNVLRPRIEAQNELAIIAHRQSIILLAAHRPSTRSRIAWRLRRSPRTRAA